MIVRVPVMECSVCQVPAVLRWSFLFGGGGSELMYQRDCKHKSGELRPRPAAGDELGASVTYGSGDESVQCATVRFVLPDDCVVPSS